MQYNGKEFKEVLWNTKAGFNPEKTMYHTLDIRREMIVVSTTGEVKEFGVYYNPDGSINWENSDKAIAFMRI